MNYFFCDDGGYCSSRIAYGNEIAKEIVNRVIVNFEISNNLVDIK
jgi:hypothetical protein